MLLRRPRIATASALVVVVSLAGAACGDESDPAPEASAGPTVLASAAATSPPGTARVTCDVPTDAGSVVHFALDLPEGFRALRMKRHETYDSLDCAWRLGEAWVAVGYVRSDDERQTLDDVHDGEEPNAVEGDDPVDDDSILDLDLDQDVPVFGATVGDRLSYHCFCDGQDTIARYAQAAGVRLVWSSVLELERETDEQLATALAGAGMVAG